MVELYSHSSKRFHGLVLNYLSKRTALSLSDTNCLVLRSIYVHVCVLFLDFTIWAIK
jgi:hypothetical protein